MAMEPGIKGERGTMPSIDHSVSFNAWKGLVCDEDSEWERLRTCILWWWLQKCKSACTGRHEWTNRTRCLSNISPASAHGPLGISEREGILQQTKWWHIVRGKTRQRQRYDVHCCRRMLRDCCEKSAGHGRICRSGGGQDEHNLPEMLISVVIAGHWRKSSQRLKEDLDKHRDSESLDY